SNSTNVLNNATVRTVLPTGIVWKDVVVPQSERSLMQYNTVTREIVWNAGTIPVGQNAKSVSFQLGITPVTNQIGNAPVLTQAITMTAIDSVTRTTVNQSKQPLTTQTSTDTSRPG